MSATTTDNERISVLGFGRALDDYPRLLTQGDGAQCRRLRFPHAIEDVYDTQGVSQRERLMMDIINQITDKQGWTGKVFDEEIVAKWRAEAMGEVKEGEEGEKDEEEKDEDMDEKVEENEKDEEGEEDEEGEDLVEELVLDHLTEPMFSYCIKELRDKAKHYETTDFVSVFDCELAVVKSDDAVPETLLQALQQGARVLEDVPDNQKDWHPGSDGKVLDLLHPSLFPLIYGVSRALPCGTVPLDDCMRFSCAGEVVTSGFNDDPKKKQRYSQRHASLKEWGGFQWLPSEVRFADDGRAAITSYVNNLHPDKHRALYPVLEQFVDAAIPLWDECLSWFRPRMRLERIRGSEEEDYDVPADITYTPPEDEAEDAEIRPYTLAEVRDGDYDFQYEDSFRDWFKENRILKQTAIHEFRTRQEQLADPEHLPVHLKKDFAAAGLQVIFKLANIHLTPEKPEFKGGSWHVEGALNEHICATALYYYDEENITPSHLAFRQEIGPDLISIPAQNEYASTEEFYGVEQDGPQIQFLGNVYTSPGRLLAFPNVLQHQVKPFSLEDPSKPGHRKILALFLVDPYVRILSTANVAPQRLDWWAEEVRALPPFNALPVEIFRMIVDLVGGQGQVPLSWEEAVTTRQKLMDQRGALVEHVNDEMENNTFSFCEH